jgi:nicotinate-nucleotide adenylyltransferase
VLLITTPPILPHLSHAPPQRPMRIGLYGGTFDPVHLGHLLVAQAALEELQLQRLFFIPAAQSPFKPGTQPTSATTRSRLLRLALAGRPEFEVSETEIRRGGVSYTVETVREFAANFPRAELFWLIGADHVPALPRWREAESLAQSVQFLVIPRPGEPTTELPPIFRLHFLKGWPLKVSASEIRDRARNRQSIRHLVPSAVAEVIEHDGIYPSA